MAYGTPQVFQVQWKILYKIYVPRPPLTRMLMALDAMALKFALAKASELLYCSSAELLVLKDSMNSSLCILNASAASSSWLGNSLLELISWFLFGITEARTLCLLMEREFLLSWLLGPDSGLLSANTLDILLLEMLEWAVAALTGLLRRASLLFKAPAAFLASISLGNRSWIVFQSTVFTVQDLPLLQISSLTGIYHTWNNWNTNWNPF